MVHHATLSPSGAAGWMKCAPKLALEYGLPYQSSEFADEGTAAHFLASECLEQGKTTAAFLGGIISVWSDDASHKRGTNWYEKDDIPGTATIRHYSVDEDMAGFVQNYIDAIYSRIEQFKLRGAVSVELLVEIRVEFSAFVGFPDQFGTSDVVLLIEWLDGGMQIDVNDLKYGRGVPVYATDMLPDADALGHDLVDCNTGNPQMMIYALGAYDQFQAMGNYSRASWCIHQPRLGHISEAECTIAALLAWAAETLRPAAERAMMYLESRESKFVPSDFSPGEKQCMFCKAKPCAAQTKHVFESVSAEFVNLDEPVQAQIAGSIDRIGTLTNEQIGEAFSLVDFIEGWCKAVRGKAESELLQGRAVPGFKLVQGRQGARKWTSEQEAEATLKAFRLKQDQMYSYSVISPTTAEKLLAKEQPKRWAKLQPLIKRADGSPSVAPESDKRPALVLAPAADAFVNVDEGEDLA